MVSLFVDRNRIVRSVDEIAPLAPAFPADLSELPTDPPVALAAEMEGDFEGAVITGIRVEEVEKGISFDDGTSVVLANAPVRIPVSPPVPFQSEFQIIIPPRLHCS